MDEKELYNRAKEFIIQDVDSRIRTKEALNHYAYYIMILIVSVVVILVPPILLGAIHGDVGFAFPTTIAGWVLWCLINGSQSIANIAILALFKMQAKKNCATHPKYIEACEILDSVQNKKLLFVPRSPKKMNTQDYSKKAICILISTLGSSIAVTSLMLSFDVYTLISTLLSTLITVILSWNAMMKDEVYWTEEYLLYAKYMQEQIIGSKTEEEIAEEPIEEENLEESITEETEKVMEEPQLEGVEEHVEIWEQRI